jgi:hypothetical protein
MKARIVVDGATRNQQSPEFQAQLRELHTSIRKRHEADLAAAGFIGRMVIRWRIAAEFRRERRSIEPSPQSLYFSRITAERG